MNADKPYEYRPAPGALSRKRQIRRGHVPAGSNKYSQPHQGTKEMERRRKQDAKKAAKQALKVERINPHGEYVHPDRVA